jgi:hypothetical protein
MINDAINRGISAGFRKSLAEWCDGYDEPQERCEMRPCDGCACLLVRWERLPWWQRLVTRRPKKPDDAAVIDTLLKLRIDDAISDANIRAKRR